MILQVVHPEIQRRLLLAAQRHALRARAVCSIASYTEKFGGLLDPSHAVHHQAIKDVFNAFDADEVRGAWGRR